ncbi:MAG: transcription elongation factor GreA [Anaerolineae bacterium]|nr:transcription elongation factor GreA [Anaerolineae bacterium]
MADKPIYLTSEGKKKLEEELKYLVTVRRKEVAAAIQSAKEEGDISENSAYDEAKLAQAFLEGRIQTIEAQLREAVIIEKNGNGDYVDVGSKVTVTEEGFDPETYYIVGSAEADPLNGRISNESPIGKALLGAKVGQTVTAETPNGEITFKVVKIE